tara:strand:+ start:335 stop:1258 length:924 start_codon:yes stop_codon:yes gene_type:complete
MLQEIVTDENLVWDKFSVNDTKFLVNLSYESINELKKERDFLTETTIAVPRFQSEILNFKKRFLVNGIGLFVINGECFLDFTNDEMIEIYRIAGTFLGTLYVQNIKNEKLVKILDKGKSMQSGGRYHQTNRGGSFHTDSPQWVKIPDFIGMYCINPAKKGGESKFVSAYKIHNEMLRKRKEDLVTLYEKFHFDKRGEFDSGESPTVFEPIFKYENNQITCRYLRDYINDGHKNQNSPLTIKQKQALDHFDEIIYNEDNIISYDLKHKDIIFFNNRRVIHGRTDFEDFEGIGKKRLMLRTWIKDESVN